MVVCEATPCNICSLPLCPGTHFVGSVVLPLAVCQAARCRRCVVCTSYTSRVRFGFRLVSGFAFSHNYVWRVCSSSGDLMPALYAGLLVLVYVRTHVFSSVPLPVAALRWNLLNAASFISLVGCLNGIRCILHSIKGMPQRHPM
jgi:hypothetical protein